jgi:hypothetical protein
LNVISRSVVVVVVRGIGLLSSGAQRARNKLQAWGTSSWKR